MIKTDRLLLRQWVEDDFDPFAEMCSDQQVMEYFPNTQTHKQSHEMAKKIQSLIADRGWGLWAVEIPHQSSFIGFVGLHIPKDSLPFSPCVEIGWRLSQHYWGNGYATEAAKAALDYAFSTLQLNQVVSFTTLSNVRSRAVMQKIGMSNSGHNFMHPDLEHAHPLCEHVLYQINKSEWQKQRVWVR